MLDNTGIFGFDEDSKPFIPCNELNTRRFYLDIERKFTNFYKSMTVMSGYAIAPPGTGKTFTSIKCALRCFDASEIAIITTRHSIAEDFMSKESLGLDMNTEDAINFQKFRSINYKYGVNEPESIFFIYDTVRIWYRDNTLVERFKNKKLLIFDEATATGAEKNSLCIRFIMTSEEFKYVKKLGISLFDKRPMDTVGDKVKCLEQKTVKSWATSFFVNCIFSYTYTTLSEAGVLPRIHVNYVRQSKAELRIELSRLNGKDVSMRQTESIIRSLPSYSINFESLVNYFMHVLSNKDFVRIGSPISILCVCSKIENIDKNRDRINAAICEAYERLKKSRLNIIREDDDFEFLHSVEIHSNVDSKSSKISQIVLDYDNDISCAVKIIYSVNMISEGVHLQRSPFDVLISCRDSNSEYFTSQVLGRLLHTRYTHQPWYLDMILSNNPISIQELLDMNDTDTGDNVPREFDSDLNVETDFYTCDFNFPEKTELVLTRQLILQMLNYIATSLVYRELDRIYLLNNLKNAFPMCSDEVVGEFCDKYMSAF